MTDFDRIAVTRDQADERIRHVKLDDSDHNAIDLDLLFELGEALERADRDGSVEAVVLGTTRGNFCVGADLRELSELDTEAGVQWLTAYFETVDLLRDTGKPTIAAVEGACVAGGNELAMGCDLVVAGESARLGQPEVGVGSTAAGGGVQLLPLVVGEKRARELLLTGELIGAEEAQRIGLINRVVSDGRAATEAASLASSIVDEKSPQAYRTIKAMLQGWTDLAMQHRGLAREVTAAVWASDEFRERAASFLAREAAKPRHFSGTRPTRENE